MKTKKILFVAHSDSLAGGGEKSLLDLVLATHKQGYSVHVSIPAEGDFSKELQEQSIPFSVCPQEFSVSLKNVSRPPENNAIASADSIIGAQNILLAVKPDLVIINTIVIPWFSYVANILGIPNIIMVREIHGEKNGFELMPDPEMFFDYIQKTANAFTFNSEYTRNSYRNYLSTDNSTIIYPVVSVPSTYTQTELLRSHKILEKDTISMIILGNIAEHKNQLEVLMALDYLVTKQKMTNLSLSIMGPSASGPYAAKLHEYITQHNLDEHVTFIPFSTTPYKNILEHDILIMASSHEAFGRVTLEGQLLERLVIGANRAGTLEIIEDNANGLLYESGNPLDLAKKIQWAIEHKLETEKIALNGRKNALKFSARSIYDRFFKLIDSYLAQPLHIRKTAPLSYSPIFALIERNKHVEKKLQEYATSLHAAIKENERLRNSSMTGRAKKLYKKVAGLRKRD